MRQYRRGARASMHLHKNHSMKCAGEAGSQPRARCNRVTHAHPPLYGMGLRSAVAAHRLAFCGLEPPAPLALMRRSTRLYDAVLRFRP